MNNKNVVILDRTNNTTLSSLNFEVLSDVEAYLDKASAKEVSTVVINFAKLTKDDAMLLEAFCPRISEKTSFIAIEDPERNITEQDLKGALTFERTLPKSFTKEQLLFAIKFTQKKSRFESESKSREYSQIETIDTSELLATTTHKKKQRTLGIFLGGALSIAITMFIYAIYSSTDTNPNNSDIQLSKQTSEQDSRANVELTPQLSDAKYSTLEVEANQPEKVSRPEPIAKTFNADNNTSGQFFTQAEEKALSNPDKLLVGEEDLLVGREINLIDSHEEWPEFSKVHPSKALIDDSKMISNTTFKTDLTTIEPEVATISETDKFVEVKAETEVEKSIKTPLIAKIDAKKLPQNSGVSKKKTATPKVSTKPATKPAAQVAKKTPAKKPNISTAKKAKPQKPQVTNLPPLTEELRKAIETYTVLGLTKVNQGIYTSNRGKSALYYLDEIQKIYPNQQAFNFLFNAIIKNVINDYVAGVSSDQFDKIRARESDLERIHVYAEFTNIDSLNDSTYQRTIKRSIDKVSSAKVRNRSTDGEAVSDMKPAIKRSVKKMTRMLARMCSQC